MSWSRVSRLVGLGLSLAGGSAPAQSPAAAPEYEIKAAYLLNFTRYVEWPPAALAAQGAFTICVLGADPFGATLDRLVRDRAVEGRRIGVRRLRPSERATGCHIAYLGGGTAALGGARARLGPGPVLLVGDGADFASSGGVIGFVLEEQTVRFQINAEAARSRGLRISSRVMTLATAVYGEDTP